MANKRPKPEEIVAKLREVEVLAVVVAANFVQPIYLNV